MRWSCWGQNHVRLLKLNQSPKLVILPLAFDRWLSRSHCSPTRSRRWCRDLVEVDRPSLVYGVIVATDIEDAGEPHTCHCYCNRAAQKISHRVSQGCLPVTKVPRHPRCWRRCWQIVVRVIEEGGPLPSVSVTVLGLINVVWPRNRRLISGADILDRSRLRLC